MRHVMSDVSGRSQQKLVEALAGQIEVAIEGVRLARDATAGAVATDDARARMGELENAGDRHREHLVTRLARTLVTPIDREDLFRLSRSIDDVLDNLRDFSREMDLFGAEVRDDLLLPPLDAINEALTQMRGAVAALGDGPLAAVEGSLRTKKLVNDVRAKYQVGLAALFSRDFDKRTLPRRELLRRLDVVGLRLGEAADALADGGLKRGT